MYAPVVPGEGTAAPPSRTAMLRFALPALLALLPLVHTQLVRSEPAAASTVTESPAELRLWFEGGIEPAFTQVALHASSGARLALGAPAAGSENGMVIVPVPMPLAADQYRVTWQTVGRDGHVVKGDFAFSVEAGTSAPPRAAMLQDSTAWGAGAAGRTPSGGVIYTPAHPEGVATSSPAQHARAMRPVRWAELALLVTALGAVAMLLLVLRTSPGSPAHERFLITATRRTWIVAMVSSGLYLAAAFARLALESNAMHGGGLGFSANEIGRTLSTGWGRAWVIGTIATVVLFVALLLRRPPHDVVGLHRPSRGSDLALAAAGLVAAVAPAMTGHAAGAVVMMPLAVFADWMHIVGASAWVGGVIVLGIAGAPAALAQPAGERSPALGWLVGAYHALAVPALILVVASGLLSSWLRVGSWGELMRTNYGDILLFKIFVVGFAALLGAYHWLRVYPRLAVATAGDDREARRLHWTLLLELVAGLVVIALTAALVTTPPPR